jgi:FMN phosphatase YigB (HAD superfamily)
MKYEKYVALDVGNVLVHANFTDFIKKLSKQFNLSMAEATYFMNRNQKLHDLGLTKIRDELGDHFKIRSEPLMEELVKDWNELVIPNKRVLNMLNELIAKEGLKVALLSNVGLEHRERMKEVLQWGNFFNHCITHFSCDVGARKPQMLYYHVFLELHPQFEGCPYVDDLQENLDMGAQFGFKPFQFALDRYVEPALADIFIADSHDTQLYELERFILDNNKPKKNPRWH